MKVQLTGSFIGEIQISDETTAIKVQEQTASSPMERTQASPQSQHTIEAEAVESGSASYVHNDDVTPRNANNTQLTNDSLDTTKTQYKLQDVTVRQTPMESPDAILRAEMENVKILVEEQ